MLLPAIIIFLIFAGIVLSFLFALKKKSRKERLLRIWGTWLACSLIGFLAVYIEYTLYNDYEVLFGGMLVSEVTLLAAIFASLVAVLKPSF